MIIVTGTKRSGTSMWMQILAGAGLEVIGDAFPKNWKDTIEAANPHGFFESEFRRGVYYATNPNPRNGRFLAPQATQQHVVKVFIPGLCRSDLAYVGRVIGTLRHWREYASSIERLRVLQTEALAEKRAEQNAEPPRYMDPVLEWWLENFALIRDLVTRKYPAHVVTYENVIERPEEVLPPILRWLGAPNPDGGVAAVSPQTRTQERSRIERDHEHAEMFDDLYDLVAKRAPITNEFLQRLNETHMALMPALDAEIEAIVRDRRQRMRRRLSRDPLNPDVMETIIHPDAMSEEE